MGLEQKQFDSKLMLFISQITQIWLQADLTAKQNYRNFWANLSGLVTENYRGRSQFGLCATT